MTENWPPPETTESSFSESCPSAFPPRDSSSSRTSDGSNGNPRSRPSSAARRAKASASVSRSPEPLDGFLVRPNGLEELHDGVSAHEASSRLVNMGLSRVSGQTAPEAAIGWSGSQRPSQGMTPQLQHLWRFSPGTRCRQAVSAPPCLGCQRSYGPHLVIVRIPPPHTGAIHVAAVLLRYPKLLKPVPPETARSS